MTSRKNRTHVLESLLKVLVDEWGYGTVRECLASLDATRLDGKATTTLERGSKEPVRDRYPSAIEIVEKGVNSGLVDSAMSPLLLNIALRFDEKKFLPTLPHVREFVEMRGLELGNVKQRAAAFRKVLEILPVLRESELRALAGGKGHGGPTQLGPLAEAIRSAGKVLRPTDALPLEPDASVTSPERPITHDLVDDTNDPDKPNNPS